MVHGLSTDVCNVRKMIEIVTSAGTIAMPDWPSEYEQLEYAVWFHLECRCDYCHRIDEYPAPIAAADESIDWSKIVAPLAQADGWTAPGELFLLCPGCRAKGVDWQKIYAPPPSGGIPASDREAFQRWLDS
jgi:hypothetical protein